MLYNPSFYVLRIILYYERIGIYAFLYFGKKPKDWTIEEAFKNRDKSIMDCAVGSDEYAEMLSNEVYDKLLIYIVNLMFDTSNKIITIKGKAFKRIIYEACIRANNNFNFVNIEE